MESTGNVPRPPRERGRWALALVLFALAAGALVAILGSNVGRVAPPALPAAVRTPRAASAAVQPGIGRRRYVSDEQPAQAASAKTTAAAGAASPAKLDAASSALEVPVTRSWMEGFYPIYEVAEKTFHVNWLLIASIHRQETAFSTAPGTYEGLNYAGCCGGPMQFNVTNGGSGTPSTWARVKDSYRDGPRPAFYDHRTAKQPSIYDDFDAIMAATHLLELDGATFLLNDSAWWAAYDYYGHDAYGVQYADEVIARAIGWSQHDFCASCGVKSSLLHAVADAYGAPVLSALEAESARASREAARAKARKREASARKRPAGANGAKRGRSG